MTAHDRLAAAVEATRKARQHVAERLGDADLGDGWAEQLAAAERLLAEKAVQVSEIAQLLELSLKQRVALRARLDALIDLLRKPHPDQDPGYDLACRDVAARLHAILEERHR